MDLFSSFFGSSFSLCPHCLVREDEGAYIAQVGMTHFMDLPEDQKTDAPYTCMGCGKTFKLSSGGDPLGIEDILYILLLMVDREELRKATRKYLEFKKAEESPDKT